ncbi:hypothetical protein CSR02_01100 [Acetobacter pomorum]|uniref:Uncharacterized protein n=1 Tax=Acetobacter pomorum TaxID=65959 RepID=A0A2G4RFS1_9PROT|nr:hypothetical protein CSR02_01100 [Acetobacter pomorum]
MLCPKIEITSPDITFGCPVITLPMEILAEEFLLVAEAVMDFLLLGLCFFIHFFSISDLSFF